MKYIVALVDHGNVRHKWLYDDYCFHEACDQLESLLRAFAEVNEVQPILVKVGSSQTSLPLSDILGTYVYSK